MKASASFFFLISLSVLVFDQLTKFLVISRLYLHEAVEILPFFNIVRVHNTGSAFGMFSSLGNSFFIAISLVAMIAVTVLIVKDKANRLGFSFILGGASGNLTDRLVHGYVIDFLDVYVGRYHWPAFNVADSALTIGIVLLTINALFRKEQTEAH